MDLAHLPAGRSGGLPDARTRRTRSASSRSRAARRWPRCRGNAAEVLLRHRRPGRDHPARADRRRHGPPLLRAPAGPGAGRVPAPCLEPILKRTLGVPLFQEQLLKIAMVAAGFTGGEAEELRRAMGFKRSVERMDSIETRLRQGMAARGIGPAAQDQIVKSHHVLRALRLPGVARGELRADRVRERVPEGAPSGGVSRGAPERVADGLLPPGHARQGRAAPRHAGLAGRRDALRAGCAGGSEGESGWACASSRA